ncbi:hypothetical protein QFZ51_003324 [Chitinophaga sp. W3I9]|uniref:DUF2185 domain-containing protein n=1 Tax=unclassified Chitinophaga TaxID=2619133 RepID=UPI003D1BEE38
MKGKKFKISAEDIIKVIDSNMGCIASDMITVDGGSLGYMYREEPTENADSGWRFLSGNESQEYTDDANHFSFYKVKYYCKV